MVAGLLLLWTQIAARCSQVSADASKAKVIRENAASPLAIKKVRIVSLLKHVPAKWNRFADKHMRQS